jgi:hypothetical protein
MTDPFTLPDLPPSTYCIPIDPPIEFQGGKFDQLVLREPRTGEVRMADELVRTLGKPSEHTNRNIHLIAKVAGVPVPVVEQAGVTRTNIAMAYLSLFLGYGPVTGEISAPS